MTFLSLGTQLRYLDGLITWYHSWTLLRLTRLLGSSRYYIVARAFPSILPTSLNTAYRNTKCRGMTVARSDLSTRSVFTVMVQRAVPFAAITVLIVSFGKEVNFWGFPEQGASVSFVLFISLKVGQVRPLRFLFAFALCVLLFVTLCACWYGANCSSKSSEYA